MERKRQREIALGAAAVAIIGIAAYRISTTTSPDPAAMASQPAATGAAAGQRPLNQKGHVAGVDLDALHAGRPEPVGTRRNPFRFTPKPAPDPPPSTGSRGPMMPPPMPMPIGPTEPAAPPRITLKFIGVMESGRAGKYAILTDGRGLPIYGKEGQVIEGRYRILRIGVESVDLAYIDGRGRQTIRQTGQ